MTDGWLGIMLLVTLNECGAYEDEGKREGLIVRRKDGKVERVSIG